MPRDEQLGSAPTLHDDRSSRSDKASRCCLNDPPELISALIPLAIFAAVVRLSCATCTTETNELCMSECTACASLAPPTTRAHADKHRVCAGKWRYSRAISNAERSRKSPDPRTRHPRAGGAEHRRLRREASVIVLARRLQKGCPNSPKGNDRTMNTKNWCVALMSLGIVGLASACSVDATSGEQEALGSTDQALWCANQDGVNAYMAALASATARELGRWLPMRDFQLNPTTYNLELTSWGKARCADKRCFNVQELLNMQNGAANNQVVFPGGDRLNTDALHTRLVSFYNAQYVCNTRPDNHTGDDCPTEYHQLTLTGIAPGACDKIFTFKATAPDGSLLKEPSQLKNQLVFLGYNPNATVSNPYLAFQSTASTVSIDPTVGLNEGDATSSGSCAAACTMISSASVVGQCCSCNGVYHGYSRSAWSPSTYLCK